MPGLTLADAQAQLVAWLRANESVAQGQSSSIQPSAAAVR